MSIAIVDYGSGNPASVQNMLRKIGVESYVSHLPKEIMRAQKIILPGVGSFDPGMVQLNRSGLASVLNELVLEKNRPILGICLGMQLMSKGSEEGNYPGLGWIDAETRKFSFGTNQHLRIPHMGWNVAVVKKPHPLFDGTESEKRFYFVHSYHVVCRDMGDVLTETSYGIEFASSFHKDNIVGVQFHPEKSHRFGYQLLKRFAEDFN
jgi:glutamine amidotransferase